MSHVSQQRRSTPGGIREWLEALGAVAAGLAAMAVVAALGLWSAGADALPGGVFPHVVAATVVLAVGGSVDVEGSAAFLARTDADITVAPLSVSLAGALATAAVFLLPLRFRAVATTGELLGRVARTAVLWLLALLLVTLAARDRFAVPLDDSPVGGIAEIIGVVPTVAFGAALPGTLGFGLLWLLVVLAVAFAVSRGAPLPSRLVHHQDAVRPAASAMLLVLLLYVAAGLAVGVVVALTRGRPAETFAVLLLGLPNVVWLAFGLGLGASWDGHVNGGIGLPMPQPLASVLETSGRQDATVNLGSLAEHDARVWLLPVAAAVLLLVAGFLTAVRSPAGTRPWRHAVHLAVALAVTVLVTGLLSRISARYGLSLLGVGDLGGLLGVDQGGASVSLRPNLLVLVLLAVLWGLAAGFLGSLLAHSVRRRGKVAPAGPS